MGLLPAAFGKKSGKKSGTDHYFLMIKPNMFQGLPPISLRNHRVNASVSDTKYLISIAAALARALASLGGSPWCKPPSLDVASLGGE